MKRDGVDDDDENEDEMILWYHVCRTKGIAYKTIQRVMIRKGYGRPFATPDTKE